jgi:hypothetical protein
MAILKILVDFENGTITPEDIIVFSDSKSALQDIDISMSSDISNIKQLTNQLLTSYSIEITFHDTCTYINPLVMNEQIN